MDDFLYYWLPQFLPYVIMSATFGVFIFFVRKGTPVQKDTIAQSKMQSQNMTEIARHLDRIATALEAREK